MRCGLSSFWNVFTIISKATEKGAKRERKKQGREQKEKRRKRRRRRD
jgi:hypothetical protein